MNREEFEALAARAIEALPAEFRERMENVVVVVERAPSRELERQLGPDLEGLYEGVPLDERGQDYGGAMPDKITLFQENIEAGCRSARQVERRIRRTLMHEIAHFFGMDDDELLEKDLY